MSNLGKNKILSNQTKEVIYNVFLYMLNLRTDGENRNYVEVKNDVSKATGVSFASVTRIIKEAQECENSGQTAFSGKVQNKRKRKFFVTGLENEDFDVQDIRRMIDSFHLTNGTHITIEGLRKKLQKEYSWGGSLSSLRRIIKNLGFKWPKAQNDSPEQCSSTSADSGYMSSIKYEEATSNSLQVNPDGNIVGEQLELLPEPPQEPIAMNQRNKRKSVKNINMVYCRLCLKSAGWGALKLTAPLGAVNMNYPGKSESFKRKEKILEIQKMITLCLPFFDSLTLNPVICNLCQTRLRTVYTFISQCFETQHIISEYVTAFVGNEMMVSLNDVIDSKFTSSSKKARVVSSQNIGTKTKNPIVNDTIESDFIPPNKFDKTGNTKCNLTANHLLRDDQTSGHIEAVSSSPKRSKLKNSYGETSETSSTEEIVMKVEPEDVIKIESDYVDYPDLATTELLYDRQMNNMGNTDIDIKTPVNISLSIFLGETDPLGPTT